MAMAQANDERNARKNFVGTLREFGHTLKHLSFCLKK